MIVFLTTEPGQHTIDEYLVTAGWAERRHLAALTYEELALRRAPWPPAVYVFSDLERLDATGLASARESFERVKALGYRTLNEPGRTLRRRELLERLHAAGVNDFQAWPALEKPPRELARPVFLRVADDHLGARSQILPDASALTAGLAWLTAEGIDLTGWLAVEHAPVTRPDGLYAKYGAFVLGGEPIARHVFFSADWQIKDADRTDAALLAEERAFVATNPHADALRRVFALAGVEFGRVDYAVRADGGLRIWEINTNPQLHSLAMAKATTRRELSAAWAAELARSLGMLDAGIPAARSITPLRRRVAWRWGRFHTVEPPSRVV